MEYDKHLAIPYCISVLISTVHFCCARYKFWKNDQTTRPSDPELPKQVSCFQAAVFGLPYEEIFPSDAEIFSLEETWSLQ